MDISRNNLLLLISDTARYITKAGETIKILYPNTFHISCLTHLLPNCALIIKSYYKDVDNLISSIKALTIKNKGRKELFSNLGSPPEPVVTRWGSWLSAAHYYSQNLPSVKRIVLSVDRDGIIVAKAKESILAQNLVEICSTYLQINDLVTFAELSTCTIENLYSQIKSLSFGNDPVKIK